jgi:hypothetical protein
MRDESAQAKPWRIWIDTGGTFTDCLALDPVGVLHRAKVLSSGALRGRLRRQTDTRRLEIDQRWGVTGEFVRGFQFRWLDLEHEPVGVAAYDAASSVIDLQGSVPRCGPGHCFELRSGVEAPILAAGIVTGADRVETLPAIEMRLATTRGTNALLERNGADVALFVTKGFGDLLLIGDQQRPDLFALRINRPPPLYRLVIEVDERLAADGSEVDALRPGPALDAARRALGEGVRVAAVALAHAYRNPDHERRLARLLSEAGFEHVSCSADLSPLIKLLPRAETAVVNAYLAPMVEAYLARIRTALSGGRLHVMTSAGGLVSAESCRAKDGLLSGPAGGVAGAAAAAARSGFERVIGFDMGGTSTDVARYDGDYEYRFEHRVGGAAGVRLVAPALAIETVAAGGGSICTFADGGLRASRVRTRGWALMRTREPWKGDRASKPVLVARRRWSELPPDAWREVLEDRRLPDRGDGPPPTAAVPVLFNPECSALLVVALTKTLHAAGSEPGVEVGPAWKLYDDPCHGQALYGGSFDDVGFPTTRKRLSNGHRTSGRIDGRGHFRRPSFRDRPIPLPSHLTVSPTAREAPMEGVLATALTVQPVEPARWILRIEGALLDHGRPGAVIRPSFVSISPEELALRCVATVGPPRPSHLGVETPALLFDHLSLRT